MIISICGNIASGKSSLLRKLAENGYHTYQEEITNWGQLLELSYQKPKEYSFVFQLRIVSEQTIQKKKILEKGIFPIFIERTTEDGRHVFVEAKKAQGYLDDVCIEEFDRWVNEHQMGIFPDYTIYLKNSPETSAKRLKDRNLPGDSMIDLNYLSLLHSLYENYYTDRNNVKIIETDTKNLDQVFDEILLFLSLDPQYKVL